MSKIPPKLLAELSSDPFMQRSCLSGETANIQWHHCLIYANRKVQARFCILPLTYWEHKIAYRPDIKRQLEEVMLERATEEDMKKYAWWFKTVAERRLNKTIEYTK